MRLWITFGALLLMLGLGVGHDALLEFVAEPARAFYNLPSVLFSYLLVTLLLDRTTEALRESLRESNARGHRLQQEMLARERAQAQLIHAQKREIVERMAGGLAHDFNNVLAVIVGFSATRHDDDAGSEARASRSCKTAWRRWRNRRGMAIIRRLLRFSRRDGEQAENFDAAAAIDALQPMLRQLLEARIVLRCALPATPAPIHLDRSQFELMLLNLANNSRDAIAERGHLDIAVRSEDAWTIIEIADDGQGMPADVRARVFEPFYSTKPADSGTGLGLAVVHDLVVRAGGHIQVHSEPGVGTRFRIALPCAGAAAGVAGVAAAQPDGSKM
ncbi:sensor histidine kinase [Xanthomonas graminis]|nr:HAMP domain-containing sensor histidine kinase [Xanthomonas translucens]UKE73291.1 HAMP domain-containing histidine kinase [Xanthomonas translucens pv. phleipratensis]